jgi:hypothetical protein
MTISNCQYVASIGMWHGTCDYSKHKKHKKYHPHKQINKKLNRPKIQHKNTIHSASVPLYLPTLLQTSIFLIMLFQVIITTVLMDHFNYIEIKNNAALITFFITYWVFRYFNMGRRGYPHNKYLTKLHHNTKTQSIFIMDMKLALLIILSLIIRSGNVHKNPGPPPDRDKNLHICHLNIRSLNAPGRLDDLSDYIQLINDFDIVALTETHLKPKIPDPNIHINNYNFFRKDRLDKMGGGVALYVSDIFHCVRRLDLEPLSSEIMWCEITFKTHKLLFGTVYRPPNQNANEIELFLTNLQDTIDLATSDNPYAMTLLGDLNDRCTTWDADHLDSELKNKLLNLLQLNHLHQLIKDPTRDNNILDLLITDAPNYYLTSGVIPSLPYLDHDAIFGKLVLKYRGSGSHVRHVWQYARGDYARLNYLYSNTSWHTDIRDEQELEHCVDHLTSQILNLASDCIPNKTVKIRDRDKPWFSRILKKLFKDRDRLHKRQKRTKDPRHIQLYKDKRKEATDAYRQAKRDYFANMSVRLLDPETSAKNYWKLIKNSMGNRQSVGIPTMTENDLIIHDDKDKATLLNDYFVSQTKIPDSKFPLPPFSYTTDARLSNVEITPSIVKQILLNLDISTATGHDQINNKILKECASSLCTPLSELFNKSLDLGIFPSNWKEAMITALFKKQNRQLKINYRPISLLSCISKVLERIIYKKNLHAFEIK